MFSFLKNIFARSSPKKKFADLLVAEIRRRGLTFPLAFDEKEFKLVSKEPQCVIYLGNMHAHYLAATTPEAKARVIAESASGCFPPVEEEDDEDFASVSPRLMVGFREKCYVEFTKLLMQMEGVESSPMETRDFTETLSLCVAIDYPDRMAFVGDKHLKAWGVAFDEAFAVARRNLVERTGPFELLQPGLYRGPWRDNYVPARLVLTEMIRELIIDGHPVAMAPNRDTLFITGSQDIEGQRIMLELTREALKEPRPMSPRPLILKDGVWSNYFPQHDTPVADDYTMLWIESTGQDYAEQKAHLENFFEKKGIDIYVASFGTLQDKETKKIETYCVWSRDVEALLPKTDVIIFHDHTRPEDQQMAAKVPWNDAQEKLGGMLQRQDLYPARFKVTSFPDAETLRSLDRG